jgi:hypothetical protein
MQFVKDDPHNLLNIFMRDAYGGKGGGLSDEAPYPDGSIFQATFSESRPEMNLCKTLDMRV